MASRPNQIKREWLNDQQWADACRLFELLERLAPRIEERKRQGKGGVNG